MRDRLLAVLAVLALGAAAVRASEIPFAYRIEVEVIQPSGAHAVIDVGYGTSDFPAALAQVVTIHRDGFCLIIEKDLNLAATCYPPSRFVRTQIVKSWL